MIESRAPAEVRRELEQLIVTDLLGPSDPHEQLPGVRSPVREWYLVGMLAPKGTVVDPSRADGDDLQDGDEGGAPGPDDRPSKIVLFPSSAGFSAAIDRSCDVDAHCVLLTSANMTNAAHGSNVELGVLCRGGSIATHVQEHFDGLIAAGVLREVSS